MRLLCLAVLVIAVIVAVPGLRRRLPPVRHPHPVGDHPRVGRPRWLSATRAWLPHRAAGGRDPDTRGPGAVDGGLTGALVVYGLSSTLAVAASLAYRAIALAIPVVFGGLVAISLVRDIRAEKTAGPAPGRVDSPLASPDSLSLPTDR